MNIFDTVSQSTYMASHSTVDVTSFIPYPDTSSWHFQVPFTEVLAKWLLPGVCGRTEDGPAAVAGAPAEGAALRGECAPLGRRAGAAPDAPRRVGGLAKHDVVEAEKAEIM